MVFSSCLLVLVQLPAFKFGTTYEVVKRLSREAGIEVAVSPVFADAVVAIRSEENAPAIKEVESLAKALQGTLKRVGNGYLLGPAAEGPRTFKQEEANWRMSQAQKWKLSEGLPSSRSFYESLEDAVRLGTDSDISLPIDHLLDGLIKMNVRQLSRQNIHTILVYSTRPTPAESALPAGAIQLLAQYEQLRQQAVLTLESFDWRKLGPRASARLKESLLNTSTIHRAALWQSVGETRVSWTLALYSQAGKLIGTASKSLSIELPNASRSLVADSAFVPRAGYSTVVQGLKQQNLAQIMPLTSLEQTDPLEWAVLPGIKQFADSKGLPFAVVLSDSMAVSSLQSVPADLNGFLEQVAKAGLDLKEEDGWLIGRLSAPWTVSRSSISRTRLLRWQTEGQQSAIRDLRAECQLAAANTDAYSSSPLRGLWRDKVIPALTQKQRSFYQIPRWLKFYLGSLSDQDWNRLLQGEALTSSGRPHGWLTDWSSCAPLCLMTKNPAALDVEMTGSWTFSSGLPPNATVTLTRLQETWLAGGGIPNQLAPISSFAANLSGRVMQPTSEEIERVLPGPVGIASCEKLLFRLQADSKWFMEAEERLNIPTKFESEVKFKDWPESLKTDLVRWLKWSFELKEPDRILPP